MGLGDFRAEAKEILKQMKADLRDVMAQCEELAAENVRLKDRNMWLERKIMEKGSPVAEVDDPTPCPVCRQPAGFHDPVIHSGRQVPEGLTWKPGEPAPWEREEAEPAHVKRDAAAVLRALIHN